MTKTKVDLMDALCVWHESHLSPAQNRLLGQVIEELARLYMVQHHAVEAARAWSTPDAPKPIEGHPVWWHILDAAGEQKAGIPESSEVTCCVQCSCAGQGGSGHVSASPLYCACGGLISPIGMPYYFDGTNPICATCFHKRQK